MARKVKPASVPTVNPFANPKIVIPQGGHLEHQGAIKGFECGCCDCHPEVWCYRCILEHAMIGRREIDRSPYFYAGRPNWVGLYRGQGRKDLCPNHNADELNQAPAPDYSDRAWHNPPALDVDKLSRPERKLYDSFKAREKRGAEVRGAIALLQGQPRFRWQQFFDAAMKSFRESNGKGGFLCMGDGLTEMILVFRDKMLAAERVRSEVPEEDKSDWNNPGITDDDLPKELFDDDPPS